MKIRAWDKKEKRMINWSDIPFETEMTLQEFCEIFLEGYSDRYIVMQYTGLKDENNKEIYAGDIIKYRCNCKWEKSKVPLEPIKWGSLFLCGGTNVGTEIIGNMFEGIK